MDAACFSHDVAYSRSKNLQDRHEADKILEKRAIDIYNSDRPFSEKSMAWMVAKAMNDKRKLGMGVKHNKKIRFSI